MKEIFERRSIRKYTEEDISDRSIKELLKAAMAAPTAGNQQPWAFIVVKNRQVLKEIPKFHPKAPMLANAPAAIVVCGVPEKEIKYSGFWPQDCSAATQNILIEAQYLGLGAVWIGIYPNEERVIKLRALLDIPGEIIPLSIVALGHPKHTLGPSERYDENNVHYEKW